MRHRYQGHLWRSAVLLSILWAALAACSDGVSREDLTEWGIPQDFPGDAQGLRDLKLPSKVDRFNWLPRNLETLDASYTSALDTSGLPPSLKSLDLSFSKVANLKDLPAELEMLDIRATEVQSLGKLPSSLRTLGLGGGISSLEGLPSGLETLILYDAAVHSLEGLPAGLRSLTVYKGSIESLEGLPGGLQALSLQVTSVHSLRGVPEALSSLELRDNVLRVESYPPFLINLASNGRLAQGIESLAHLERLEVGNLSEATLSSLPPALSSLKATSISPGGDLSVLPREITVLELPDCRKEIAGARLPLGIKHLTLTLCEDLERLPILPEGLESLDLSGTKIRDLSGLRKELKLKSLTLGWWEMESLPDLPDSLETLSLAESISLKSLRALPPGLKELNLSRTGLADLPDLPRSLRTLDISGMKLRQRSLDRLPDLEELTVSPGQLISMKGLPSTLQRLRFREN